MSTILSFLQVKKNMSDDEKCQIVFTIEEIPKPAQQLDFSFLVFEIWTALDLYSIDSTGFIFLMIDC